MVFEKTTMILRAVKNSIYKIFTNLIIKNKIIHRVITKIREILFSIFKPKMDHELFNKLLRLSETIPDYCGSSYYKKSEINVAIITDEFMYNYYKDAINLFYITLDNYKEIIDNQSIDYVMFISCWNGLGNNEDWKGQQKRGKTIDVFKHAKAKGTPCIFQSIEDPSNYTEYIDIAKYADYIFTSSKEKVEDYINDTNNKNVYYLEYGINPTIHNPVGCFEKYYNKKISRYRNNVFFAGSWATKYKERCDDLKTILDGVLKAGRPLIIADRNSEIPGYTFPLKFRKNIIPSLEHSTLQKVHKLFNFNINVNSIKHSSTMCAMRVYEIQALGGLMISNYALSVSNTFPNIFIAFTPDYVKEIVLSYDDIEFKKMQVQSIRNVYSNSTVYDRLNFMFGCIKGKEEFDYKTVYCILESNDNSQKVLDLQTYKHIVILSEEEARTLQRSEGYFIYIEEENACNVNFVGDLVNAFKYTDVDFIEYNNSNAYRYTDNNIGINMTLYNLEKVTPAEIGSKRHLLNGFNIYMPWDDDQNIISQENNAELGVIIPVYNNGKFLRDRCINSLLRSSIFNKMHIYIIDDGSDDKNTIDIIHELKKAYSNVSTYFYSGNGSGSASRPRNKGIEICTQHYVTFLDPDNEAINDGYAKLLNLVKSKDVDMAFGTIYKVNEDIKKLSYSSKEELITNPREDLLERNFRSQSIQACLAKRTLILENNIVNPEGAMGQDTLFFHELMLNSKKAFHTRLPIHIYYADRADSNLNMVTKDFFEKFKLMEQYQAKKYKEYGVIEDYKSKKLEYFIKNWYYVKLMHVSKEEVNECIDIIEDIKELYK